MRKRLVCGSESPSQLLSFSHSCAMQFTSCFANMEIKIAWIMLKKIWRCGETTTTYKTLKPPKGKTTLWTSMAAMAAIHTIRSITAMWRVTKTYPQATASYRQIMASYSARTLKKIRKKRLLVLLQAVSNLTPQAMRSPHQRIRILSMEEGSRI